MNKNFKLYSIVWVILLAVFNVVAFFIPAEAAGMSKFDGTFWVAYIFITLAFIGQLAVSCFAFQAKNLQKFFYRIPLIHISWSGVFLTLIFGSLCMAIPNLPAWVCVIVCFVVLGFNAMVLVKAELAAGLVSGIDDKTKTQSFFIKAATADTDTIMSYAQTDSIRVECRKVYEALRYSDPMSNTALTSVEGRISDKLTELLNAVKANNEKDVASAVKELIILIGDRNNKCKLLK